MRDAAVGEGVGRVPAHEQGRCARPRLANRVGDLRPDAVRQDDVAQEQVDGPATIDVVDGRADVVLDAHRVAEVRQRPAGERRDRGLVVDHQDRLGAARPALGLRAGGVDPRADQLGQQELDGRPHPASTRAGRGRPTGG